MNDQSLARSDRDVQTVTKDGTSVASTIDGVKTRSTTNHVDHRGAVYEIFEGDLEFWGSPIVYAYQFSIRPHLLKGWGLHENKTDRYTIISGETLLFLYDSRPDSPTHGVAQKITMGDRATRQVIIPHHVWHISLNLGDEEARLINFPTEVYHHEAPDRRLLPWDTTEIPVRITDYFPKF
jgi:dTDP-4-dehydrorhamnose 3,5-epimerase